ncbi:unnamed protein product [Nippostrongylus brasiliensis]|uniref:DRAG-1 (inferred by orthology to a C. elegans protein) n=1 Tax=Nippostrongylus brasiliensis TaxID=27835 RepID=A0A0N4YXE8_NIPBR|nr:unnamed protein product [Nippostrongylus brasiliensis]
MDSEDYQDMLREHHLPYLRRIRRHNLIFQQHNAPIHITILIRRHNCTPSLRYEAASEEETLSISFVDGVTRHVTEDRRTTVEVIPHGDYVEVAMHYIQSSVHIRRRGPYLSVSVVVPKTLQGTSSPHEALCTVGCRNNSIVAIDKALAAPVQYARCFARKLHVPMKLATDRCRTVNVTDEFFDACVFDLMLTGKCFLSFLLIVDQYISASSC